VQAVEVGSNEADLVLAVAGRAVANPEREGAYEAECELVVARPGAEQQQAVIVRHRWQTARSEVSRLFGLMALNQLRLELLKQDV
jgi:hypothetical protein